MANSPDDQKQMLVARGMRAYVQQMANRNGDGGRFNQPQIRMPLRRPRTDINRNVAEKLDEIQSSNDSDRGNVFKDISNDPPPRAEAVKKAAIIENCVCLRTTCLVFCRFCGYHNSGRIKKTCRVHPNWAFLMDLIQCPLCKTTTGLSEHPLPTNYPKKNK